MPHHKLLPPKKHSVTPPLHKLPKHGRNDLCPCGSGKKYKKCCLIKALLQRSTLTLIATDTTHLGNPDPPTHAYADYFVTTEPLQLPDLTPEESSQLAHYHNLLMQPHASIDDQLLTEMEAFCTARKAIPQLGILLGSAYQAAGEKEKAAELIHEIYERFPHYFFARINMVLHWLRQGELELAASLLEGKRTIKEFIPSQREFHLSAIETFHHTMVVYSLTKEDLAEARWHYHALKQVLDFFKQPSSSVLAAAAQMINTAEAESQ